LRKAATLILVHVFLILLACTLFIPAYNLSFSSDSFDVNATLVPQINDVNPEKYAWYLSGTSTYIEDFEDQSHSFTVSIPALSGEYYAYDYSVGCSQAYSVYGSLSDTQSDDGVSLRAWTGESTGDYIWIEVYINVTDIPAGATYNIRYDGYATATDATGFSKTAEIKVLDSSGTVLASWTGTWNGVVQRTKNGDVKVVYRIYAEVASYGLASSMEVGVDFFKADYGDTAGTSTVEVTYVASHAGTTSKNAGFSPLFDLGNQLYGYRAVDEIDYVGTYTITHSWDITDVEALTAVADFCIFVNYATVDSTYVNYIKLIIEYVYTSCSVQYIVYFAEGETGTLEMGVSGSQYYVMYRLSVKLLWVGLRTFDNKQQSEIVEDNGGALSGQLTKINIKVEFSVTSTSGNEPRCDFIIDWVGAWTPQDEISSIKYSLFYEISHKGFENITIVTVPTLDYDNSQYRQVLLFYDTRYPAQTVSKILDWANDIDPIFTKMESYFSQLGFAVERVDADELANYLSGGVKAIVVFLSGILPDTVYKPSTGNYLIRDWLRNGGVLLWSGDWIGYYYGKSDGTKVKIGGTGDDKVFGVNVIDSGYGNNWANTYVVEGNVTPLGESLGIPKPNFAKAFSVTLYEMNEGGNYLLYAWERKVVIDTEGKPVRNVKVGLGWFEFDEGWACVHIAYSDLWNADKYVKMIVTAPFRQNKDVTNMQVWDDGYITTDVFYDDTFRECNSPDEEDPAEGFGENFAGISDWSTDSGGDPTVSWSTDGDKLVFSFSAADSADDYAWIYKTVSIDLTQYPFLEVRWKGECTVGDPYFYIYAVVSDGSTSQGGWLKSHLGAFDWTIDRVNILEWARTKFGSAYTTLTKIRIYINDYPNTEETDCTLYVDWIRVYGLSDYGYLSKEAGSGDYAYSDGDVLCIHMNFDQSSVDEYMGFRYDITDFDATGKWAEARTKGYLELFFRTSDGYFGWIIESSDWVISKVDLENRQIYTSAAVLFSWNTGTSKTITAIDIALNDISQYDSGVTKEGYYDYIKIGKKGDWRPIWEFSASKLYDNPYWHFYDSLISPKWNLPENVPVGVYQYQIGVLILIWGYNYIDGDYMYVVEQQDVASIRAIHTYSWGVFYSEPKIKAIYGFTWPPNLAIISNAAWLLWTYAICLDVFAIYVKKRQLYILSTLLVIAGIYLIL